MNKAIEYGCYDWRSWKNEERYVPMNDGRWLLMRGVPATGSFMLLGEYRQVGVYSKAFPWPILEKVGR